MGRPRLWKNDAERMRARRAAQKAGQAEAPQEPEKPARTAHLQLRLSPEEKAAWIEHAGERNLSEFIRQAVNERIGIGNGDAVVGTATHEPASAARRKPLVLSDGTRLSATTA